MTSFSPVTDAPDFVLAAAREEFESVGLSRSSLDAIAKNAGVSRSTLYRRFTNKEALILAVLEKAVGETMHELDRATRGRSPQDAVVAAFVGATRALNSSRLYRRVFIEEPAIVRGLASTVRAWTFSEVATRVSKTLRRAGAEMPEAELLVVAELLVRVARSYAEIPSTFFAMENEAEMRTFAQRYLAPMVY